MAVYCQTLADDKHVDVTLKWHIGGAMHVDSTHVVYSPYDAPIKELESHFPPSDRQQPGSLCCLCWLVTWPSSFANHWVDVRSGRQAAWRALVDGGAVDASLLTTGRSQSGPTEYAALCTPLGFASRDADHVSHPDGVKSPCPTKHRPRTPRCLSTLCRRGRARCLAWRVAMC